ncbi:hypothetical protein SEA_PHILLYPHILLY_86 [Microbacterium phage PhillyPhilly]|nr:hypothetical protein SEA_PHILLYPHILLY_86 [Microbacterium phage PhillyPhilly]
MSLRQDRSTPRDKPSTQQKGPIMASYTTRKNETKFETIARRAQRAAKYANASTMSRSGRVRKVAKAAY